MENLKVVLDNNIEKYLQPLQRLTRIDTQDIGHGILGGREKLGQEMMIELYKSMGADSIDVDQMDEKIIQKAIKEFGEGNEGHNYEDRFNVTATFKGKKGKSILFNGHIDTMPPGEEADWKYPPFRAKRVGDRIYGLGIADMKSGLLAPAMALQLLKDANIELPGDVVLTSVVDEEGGGNGSIQAAMRGIKADAAVVCEPTDRQLIIAHMGFVFFEVNVEGKAIHSGSKWLGVSAIDKAIKLIAVLNELEHQWLMTYKHPLLPSPTLNVGVIEGGSAGSTVSEKCTFKCCIHYHPQTMTYESVVKEFEDTVLLACQGDAWLKDHIPKMSVYQAGGSFEMEEDSAIVDSFKSAFKKAQDRDVKVVGSPAGCDSRVWKNIAGIPTIQYGPGRQSECHTIDEYVEIEQYKDAILTYANLILEWGQSKEEK